MAPKKTTNNNNNATSNGKKSPVRSNGAVATNPNYQYSSNNTTPAVSAAPQSADEMRVAANLRVLQRLDAETSEILGVATHVVIYEFDSNKGAWQKGDIEGTMFIVKRNIFPRFRMVSSSRERERETFCC
jgi:hypothetical protein